MWVVRNQVQNNAQGLSKAQGGDAAHSTCVQKHLQDTGMTHSMCVTVVASEEDGKQTGLGGCKTQKPNSWEHLLVKDHTSAAKD